ncbi:protein DpdF [Mesorhizobium sp. ES1-6]|uniref:protein DpdF n=1 Tax=Mesorhizobium sp. ES1-6 TaxID=2876626 RepID=UPI001CCEFE78|nr:protein DpdF [Mesorhizobium sp. ES1-6]MBZ9803382.1 DEAD/DEAH box helicase [Mesorhizobium sp. ES1-6]
MIKLDGNDAFAALTRLLGNSDDGETWRAFSPSIDRLRLALSDASQHASPLDLAVLLRQAMRYEHARRSYAVSPTVLVAHPRFGAFDQWERVGLRTTPSAHGRYVTALAWQPSWLVQNDDHGVDGFAASEMVCREFNAKGSEGDPFLASVGRTSYRSRGQRAAVRAALSTPAGGTLVVALPTGEGKSMIFQLAQSVGFVGTSHAERRGVTLVIVPTVALGINHEQEAVDVCRLSKPLAFQGGNDVQNGIIAERITEGSQGLCFASPEAACGRLRDPLRRAAEAGHLRALVVDEAHLVDQWGTGFRTEFQELSGLRRELIAAAPPAQRMRTLLLSATLTDSSLETLRALFGIQGDFESIAAVQLRPEPDYWIAPVTGEQTRIDQVSEALHHLPRPAVLYVTEVDQADKWHNRLIAAGFGRVRKLHGKTSRAERELIVAEWRDGLLDIVVGTSAFGLGIDYPHARSIVHACVPETLDRFYQEVGRGGRDGKASLSLIVPTNKDFATAAAINAQQVISIDRGLKRWSTMFARKLQLAEGRFVVRIDGRPGADEHDIDMFGETNTDWNLRTLALMARAGLVRLLGTPYPRVKEAGDWLQVEIVDDHHLDKAVWALRVEPVRREGWMASKRNLDLMREFLGDARCPAEVLEELYSSDRLGRACSRCSNCRTDPTNRHRTVPVGEPRAPWIEPLHPTTLRLLDSNLRLLVTYEAESLPRAASRRLGECLHRLQQAQFAKLLLLGAQLFDMPKILKFAEKVPFFVSEVSSLALSRLPRGPEVVMVGEGQVLEEQNLVTRPKTPRIFITPQDQMAVDGRRLRDVFGGRTLTLDEFFERVIQ